MSLIKKPSELEIPCTIKAMIYGQPGTGKSTLALSAPSPVHLDFDGGVRRVNIQHAADTLPVTSWGEVVQLLTNNVRELDPYQTIIVDTIGKMIEFIIASRCGTRQPTIKDWGGINQDFKWFTTAISTLGKHVIFVAHRDSRKEGDDTVFIPSLREKNYNAIVTELDLLGYVEMRVQQGQQTRTITFDPTNRNDGKNTCNLPSVINIPTILDPSGKVTAPNDFFQREIIARYAEIVRSKEAALARYHEQLAELQEAVTLITDAQGANEFVANIDVWKTPETNLLLKARELFSAHVQTLNLKYDKDEKRYENAV